MSVSLSKRSVVQDVINQVALGDSWRDACKGVNPTIVDCVADDATSILLELLSKLGVNVAEVLNSVEEAKYLYTLQTYVEVAILRMGHYANGDKFDMSELDESPGIDIVYVPYLLPSLGELTPLSECDPNEADDRPLPFRCTLCGGSILSCVCE